MDTTTTTEATTTTTPEGLADVNPATETATAAAEAVNPQPQGAPEQYEWTLPDNSPVDESVLNNLGEWAKGQNLTQEQVNGLLDAVLPKMQESQKQGFQSVVNGWLEQAKQDVEFGGAKFDESLATARKAVEAYASPELIKTLDETGLGNHPELIRAFVKIGQTISEDKFVGGNPTSASSDDMSHTAIAKALYG